MEKRKDFDTIAKDFELDREQMENIVHLIHNLHYDGASRKLVYNEITTKGFGRKQLDFAFLVMGFYEALQCFGVIIDE